MSNSVRQPYWTEGYGSKRKLRKRRANKKVRKSDVASGGAYKKVYDSWDICDYRTYDPESERVRRK
jgi:hypothetical protein